MRLAVQLYTLRNLDESLPETIERLGDTPYEGVQFAGLGGASPDDLAAALDRANLDVAGAHVDLEEMEDRRERTLEAYDAVDCDQLVVPSYEREAFETREGAEAAGERLAGVTDRLEPAGVDLHYHNHTFEFTEIGEETAFDAFAAAAGGVGLEIDTGLASHAGVDPVALLERYADRVSLVHLTDSRPGSEETLHVDLGTGTVDIEACVDAAREAGAEWLIFEHGLTDHPLDSVADAAERLDQLL